MTNLRTAISVPFCVPTPTLVAKKNVAIGATTLVSIVEMERVSPCVHAQTTEQSSSPAGISPQISQLIAQPMVITRNETAIVQDGHENEPQDKLTAR